MSLRIKKVKKIYVSLMIHCSSDFYKQFIKFRETLFWKYKMQEFLACLIYYTVVVIIPLRETYFAYKTNANE